ncbi:MAG: hypothetical protein ACO27F_11030, partial [Beijerinckiaceae bacterium]
MRARTRAVQNARKWKRADQNARKASAKSAPLGQCCRVQSVIASFWNGGTSFMRKRSKVSA